MTLDRYVKQKGRLSPEEAIPILRAVARALDAAHAAGIAHRDLKPENVFLVVEDDGTVFPKLLDFGIAKLLGDAGMTVKTRTGQPMGTPFYMSPEQCRGKSVDHRTDIYSFGILVHEALTGRLPFTGDDLMDLLVKQTTATPPALSSVCAEIPKALDAPVLDMLKKDPAARPTSVGSALEALARAAQDAGLAVQVVPRSGDLRRSGDGEGAPAAAASRSGMTPAQMAELSEAKTIAEIGAETKTLLNAAADVPPRDRRRMAVLVGAVSLIAGITSAVGFPSWSSRSRRHRRTSRSTSARRRSGRRRARSRSSGGTSR
jgi:serine/threonine-protein kinase